MKNRLLYNSLFLTLVLYFGLSAFVHVNRAAATPPPAREDSPVKVVPLATQDIGLQLVGTVVSDDPEFSVAFIHNEATKKQGVYREGDRVGKKAVVKKILRNRVIIDAGSGEVMLTMMHGQPSISQPAPYQEATVQSPAATVTNTRVARAEINAAAPDYMQLMRTVRVRPYFLGGQRGFMIYNIEPESVFAKMGLENGDVIRAVNGKAVTSTQEALVFYNSIKNDRAVALDIQRGETPQALRVEIQ